MMEGEAVGRQNKIKGSPISRSHDLTKPHPCAMGDLALIFVWRNFKYSDPLIDPLIQPGAL